MLHVVIVVLTGIDDSEPRGPEQDGNTEDDRDPPLIEEGRSLDGY